MCHDTTLRGEEFLLPSREKVLSFSLEMERRDPSCKEGPVAAHRAKLVWPWASQATARGRCHTLQAGNGHFAQAEWARLGLCDVPILWME